MSDPAELIAPIEAAKILGISRRRVYQLLREGLLPHQEVVGGQIVLIRGDIERAAREGWAGRRPRREQDSDEGYPGLADDPELNEDAAREASETPGMGS